MTLERTVAVVVHHKSYDTVGRAVQSLLDQGIHPTNILVIDNSEEPHRAEELLSSLPKSVAKVMFVANKGYGAAVNSALDHYAQREGEVPDFFLVATHETNPRGNAVEQLALALIEDQSAAVAGPTLISGSDPRHQFVWSTGGYLSGRAHLPRHFSHRGAVSDVDEKTSQPRQWLDGSFLLYRWSDVETDRIDERFFLYMEETDFHLRLGRRGRSVLWVPTAVTWQDSNGVPPYYFARNLRLLFKKNEPAWRQVIVPFAVARAIASGIIKRRNFAAVRPSLRGLFEKLPARTAEGEKRGVVVVNPLGSALAHFQAETESVIRATGSAVTIFSVLEPSASGSSRLNWILQYARTLRRARRTMADSPVHDRPTVLVLWPVLGFLDFVMISLFVGRAQLIIHDPRPLVTAVGYDSISRRVAGVFRSRVTVIALSEPAIRDLRSADPRLRVTLLPHPILSPGEMKHDSRNRKPIVQVLGQFKRDRDLDALAAISDSCGASFTLRIDGRGWPEVPGWAIRSRFVPESELDQLIIDSKVVIIPYRRFYQSGIALRCLELLTPVVGPRQSSLAEVFGSNSPLLAEATAEGWSSAVESAVHIGNELMLDAALLWRERCTRDWSQWLGGTPRKA